MRKIIAYLAASADGYIARANGSVDWLDRPRPEGNYGLDDFIASIDTIVWGRATYDQTLSFGMSGDMFGEHIHNYVFTHRAAEPAPQTTFLSANVSEFAEALRAQPGKDVWLMGGASLFSSFLDANAVDELWIFVVPVLLGDGIPIFSPRKRHVPLQLWHTEAFEDGVVQLRYLVG